MARPSCGTFPKIPSAQSVDPPRNLAALAPHGGEGQATCNTPGGGEKVPGDFWFLPHPELLGLRDTDVHRRTESPPSLPHCCSSSAAQWWGWGRTSLANQRETRLFRIKVQPHSSRRLGPQRAQGRGWGFLTGSEAAGAGLFREKVKGQSFSSQDASSCPPTVQGGCDLRQKGQGGAGRLGD